MLCCASHFSGVLIRTFYVTTKYVNKGKMFSHVHVKTQPANCSQSQKQDSSMGMIYLGGILWIRLFMQFVSVYKLKDIKL